MDDVVHDSGVRIPVTGDMLEQAEAGRRQFARIGDRVFDETSSDVPVVPVVKVPLVDALAQIGKALGGLHDALLTGALDMIPRRTRPEPTFTNRAARRKHEQARRKPGRPKQRHERG